MTENITHGKHVSNIKSNSLQPNHIFTYIFSNVNPFPKIHPKLIYSYITQESNKMFDSKLSPLSDIDAYHDNQISLIPVDEKLKEVLHGGFYLGNSYEIKGPSLSGKTLLINTLLYSNVNRLKKCLFFDFIGTSLWKIDWENKIEHINNLYTITEVLHTIKKIPKGKYDVVVFDPITIILANELEINSEVIKLFTNEINILLYKKNTTVIYTSSIRRLQQNECFDENTKTSWLERDYQSLTPLLFLPINKTEICLYRKSNNEKQLFFVGNLYARVIGANSENDYFELPSLSG